MEKNRLIRIYGTSLIEKDGKILLQQEGNELTYGKWYFPSGRMDEKEFILDCAIRETLEETGYKVKLKNLIGIYQYEFSVAVVSQPVNDCPADNPRKDIINSGADQASERPG